MFRTGEPLHKAMRRSGSLGSFNSPAKQPRPGCRPRCNITRCLLTLLILQVFTMVVVPLLMAFIRQQRDSSQEHKHHTRHSGDRPGHGGFLERLWSPNAKQLMKHKQVHKLDMSELLVADNVARNGAGGASKRISIGSRKSPPSGIFSFLQKQQASPPPVKLQSRLNDGFKPKRHRHWDDDEEDFDPMDPPPGSPRIWLYTLIGADYQGAATMLPFWLQHYMSLGFRTENMLVVINHNCTAPQAKDEFSKIVRVLADHEVPYYVWTERYSSDAHLKIKLQFLEAEVTWPEDWIVIADNDEFYNFTEIAPTIQEVLAKADAIGSSWILGSLVDRVANDGGAPDLKSGINIWDQFPLDCLVVKHLTGGYVWKTTAFKAYLRSNTGNHYIVEPDSAKAYFGAARPGQPNRRGGFYGAEDLYKYTPYYKYHSLYKYKTTRTQPGQWQLLRYPVVLKVFHFKWHSGVLKNAEDRFAFYKGDMDRTGQPRFKHYFESENILKLFANGGKISLQDAKCAQGAGSPMYHVGGNSTLS